PRPSFAATVRELSLGTAVRDMELEKRSPDLLNATHPGFVLGLVAAGQRGFDVWGRLSGSGEIRAHTGRPSARCPWFGSFSGGPRSEPDGHLSVHPALQRCLRAVRGWLPVVDCLPAACADAHGLAPHSRHH